MKVPTSSPRTSSSLLCLTGVAAGALLVWMGALHIEGQKYQSILSAAG